jgi:hypothetical protein
MIGKSENRLSLKRSCLAKTLECQPIQSEAAILSERR